MNEKRCPDCGVPMETGTVISSVDREPMKFRTDESAGGVLGKLGMKETLPISAWACPECGLVRFYAESG
ncbi:MAG: PF20097 family protein [Halalkalicoccus sp.]|nr:PF20097 family protein [Halalkalicoccus sp.]